MQSSELILPIIAIGCLGTENYILRQENGHLSRLQKATQAEFLEATHREESWRQAYFRALIVPDEEVPYTQPSTVHISAARSLW